MTWTGLCLLVSLTAAGPDWRLPDRTGWFPFLIPDLAEAATEQAVLDLSDLSPAPAGAAGFLRADGERIVDGEGREVRLFGTNICDYHPMMPKELAPRAARRLQQLGVNFVRLHYFDFASAPRGILTADGEGLDRDKLDQLDFLIAQLIEHGIYINLNLHVVRGWPDLPPGYRMGKQLSYLHQPYIASQQRYAAALLGHTNPYRRRRYTEEPGIACIELTNEDTALRDWHRYAALPESHRRPLTERWNQWLRARYGDTARLQRAWAGAEVGLTGPELLAPPGGWTYQQSAGEGSLTVTDDSLRWEVTSPGTALWHHQLMWNSLPLRPGERYTLTLTARAPGGEGTLNVAVMQQQEPWRTVVRARTVTLTDEWRTYRIPLVPDDAGGIPIRLNLDCGNRAGLIELRGLSLRAGALSPLADDQTIEAGNIGLLTGAEGPAACHDYVRWLHEQELAYIAAMTETLRDRLGCQQMILCTQVTYGGAAGLLREQLTADLVDCHAYPDHPRETTIDGHTYRATSHRSLTGGGLPGLTGLALRRVAGKPYMVSEFDLNPPNDYAAQAMPFLALLANAQGWSALAEYAWYNFSAEPGVDRLASSFGTVGHSSQMAFFPASALLFRLGLTPPLDETTVMQVPADTALALTASHTGGWTQPDWGPEAGRLAWTRRVAQRAIRGGGKAHLEPPATASARPEAPLTDGRSYLLQPGADGWLVVRSERFACYSGPLGEARDLGAVQLRHVPGAPERFGQIAVVSPDGEPLADARRLLVTFGGRTENAGQRWTPDRTIAEYGSGPPLCEPLAADLVLPAGDWRAWTLTAAGAKGEPVPLTAGALPLRPEQATLWYWLER